MKWSDYFIYDESSKTCLRWINSKAIRVTNGVSPAGSFRKRSNGDKAAAQVELNGVNYFVHRIIWEMFNGAIPNKMIIDHIDGDPWNNKIDNLRMTVQKVNAENMRMRSDNKSGTTGVHWHKPNNITYAVGCIHVNGKPVQKYFSTKTYGLLPAFKMAFVWRQEQIKKLNESGRCYTERHGKDEHENQNHQSK